MYYGFIRGLPLELEEAASLTGRGSGTIFFSHSVSAAQACSATTVIFIGLSMWNDFLTPLIIGQVKTITVGIYSAIGPYSSDYGTIFAFVFLATLPVLVTYLCLQNQFISGLTAGAMKG
jgi:raffinose/stachyose/melibiose transport system permease protein